MPKLTMEVPHSLGQDEAVRRLKDRFDTARGAYQSYVSESEEHWDDHTLTFGFRAVGMKVSGTIEVEADRIRLAAELPIAAMMLKGMIEQRAREELSQMLS